MIMTLYAKKLFFEITQTIDDKVVFLILKNEI